MSKKDISPENQYERRANMGQIEKDVSDIKLTLARWEERFGGVADSVGTLASEFRAMNGSLRALQIEAANSKGSCDERHRAIADSLAALWRRSDSTSKKVYVLGGVYAFLGGLMGWLAGYLNK